MPRLLIVTTVPSTMNAFLVPFVRHFRGLGWTVDGMAAGITADARCREAFNQVFDVDWSRNPADPRNLVGRPARIRAVVEREGYDLVHVHTPVAAFVTRFALRGMKRPAVVYTAHGFHFYKGGGRLGNTLFLALEKLAGRWTDALIVINREDAEAAREHRLVPPDGLYPMPGIGVECQAYEEGALDEREARGVRQELGLAEGQPLFLMVAEFIPRKRHGDMLRAFAKLEVPDAVLALAGTGPLESEMKALAEALAIADRVRFLGFRSDVPRLLQVADAMLLPSAQEGLPRSIMEAMCLGVPVIASAIRGNVDLLEGGYGHLVPLGDVQGLTAAMRMVLERPAEAREMGRRGKAHMRDFDVRRVVEMHEKVYGKFL